MSSNKPNIITIFLTLLIKFYQKMISPLLGSNCCYYPSCSQYAIESLNRHGIFKGGLIAIKRIGRCHPLSEGGHDPVPEINNQTCEKDCSHKHHHKLT